MFGTPAAVPGTRRRTRHATTHPPVTGDTVTVVVEAEWVRAVDIHGIVPEPDSQVSTTDGLELALTTQPGTQVTVSIAYRATELWSVHGSASVGGDTARFSQFVVP